MKLKQTKEKTFIDKIAKKLKFKKFEYVLEEKFGYKSIDYEACNKQIKSGTIIKLKNKELHLVGDVNKNLGVCDDCANFTYEDIKEVAYLEDLFQK